MERTLTTQEDLIKAVERGDTIEVKRLLEAGADVNAKNEFGSTPLHWACVYGRLEIARLLLEHGANVNASQQRGGTPLDLACLYQETSIVRLFLEAGADPTILDKWGFGPLNRIMGLSDTDPHREEILELFRQYAPELVMEKFCTMSMAPGGM